MSFFCSRSSKLSLNMAGFPVDADTVRAHSPRVFSGPTRQRLGRGNVGEEVLSNGTCRYPHTPQSPLHPHAATRTCAASSKDPSTPLPWPGRTGSVLAATTTRSGRPDVLGAAFSREHPRRRQGHPCRRAPSGESTPRWPSLGSSPSSGSRSHGSTVSF